ncbi:MAG: hypothetical protein JWR69_4743 [Pedosphaera sp.]|nr:hypothetical protein [Pedosphaera sp.]
MFIIYVRCSTRMKKASIWGAGIYGVVTVLTQAACSSLHGGESLIGLLLMVPWVTVFFPLLLCYRLFGLDWRVGAYGNITFVMLLAATALNVFLGALLGAAVWKLWQSTKRLFTKNEHA